MNDKQIYGTRQDLFGYESPQPELEIQEPEWAPPTSRTFRQITARLNQRVRDAVMLEDPEKARDADVESRELQWVLGLKPITEKGRC